MAERLRRRSASHGGISEVTLAHVYRAEVDRSTTWRTRLDTTTNWAITTTAAVISLAFTNPATPHATLLVGAFLVFTFLVIEARRYRYYDLWAQRVRLFESGYLGPLVRREPVTVDFYSALASELSRPQLRISAIDSLGFRLRRTYAPILGLLLGAWIVKLDIHPVPAETFEEFLSRARIGPMPAVVLWIVWLLFSIFMLWLAWFTARSPLPPTELRSSARRRKQPLATVFAGVRGPGRVRTQLAPRVRPAESEDRLA